MMRKDLAKMHALTDTPEFVDHDVSAVNLITEISESVQFTQMKIYMANFKFEKALALIDQIYQDHLAEVDEPNTMLFILKQKYQV